MQTGDHGPRPQSLRRLITQTRGVIDWKEDLTADSGSRRSRKYSVGTSSLPYFCDYARCLAGHARYCSLARTYCAQDIASRQASRFVGTTSQEILAAYPEGFPGSKHLVAASGSGTDFLIVTCFRLRHGNYHLSIPQLAKQRLIYPAAEPDTVIGGRRTISAHPAISPP